MAENRWTSTTLAKYEVMRSNLGYLQIVAPTSLYKSGDLVLEIKTFNLPIIEFEAIELPFGHDHVWIPGKKAPLGELSVTYWDTADGKVFNALKEWHYAIVDFGDKNKMGAPSKYKTGKADLFQFLPGEEDKAASRHWTLENIWPLTIGYGAVDKTDGTPIDITVTFKVDYYDLVAPKVP